MKAFFSYLFFVVALQTTLCTVFAAQSSTNPPDAPPMTAVAATDDATKPSETTPAAPATVNNQTSLILPLEDRPQLVQDAFKNDSKLYHFALGSNMLRSKVANRSSDGEILIERMIPAIVHGHRLAFNMRGFPPLEPGMGSLEPVDSNYTALYPYDKPECHGALLELTPQMYERVMKSEGIGSSTMAGYQEVVVRAVPYDTTKPAVLAIALAAKPHVKLSKDPSPSARYMNILREGAAELQLTKSYQDYLAQHPVQNVQLWLRKLAVSNLVFMFTIGKLLNNWRGLSKLQSHLLFQVYAPGNAGRGKRIASDVLTAAILLPGAIGGVLVRIGNKILKKELSPFMAVMIKRMDKEQDKTTIEASPSPVEEGIAEASIKTADSTA